MSQQILNTRLALLNDTTANWDLNSNGVLLKGEIGIEFTADGKAKMKIGDGVTAWKNLSYFGGESESGEVALGDGKSIVVEEGKIKLFGFDSAEAGQVPMLGSSGNLVWYTPITAESITEITNQINDLGVSIDTVTTRVDGITTTLSELAIAVENFYTKEEIDAKVSTLSESISKAYKYAGSVLTYADLPTENVSIGDVYDIKQADEEHGISAGDNVVWNGTDWDNLHGLIDTSKLATKEDVATNKTLIDKIAATYMKQAYELVSKPSGTLVDYRDKEIRIMCPADTAWTLQSSGENANPDRYYLGLRIYAPNDSIVSFKEDIADTISDDTMYTFDGEFAGIDKYGRKYSVIWLPAAAHDADTDEWTYYGKNSSVEKFIGWFYSVEWYNAAGIKVGSDCIRINLSNESCHNYIGTYTGKNAIPTASETVLGGVKSSTDMNKVKVNADGTMEINTISINNIVQEKDTIIVLNCGGASSVIA